MKKFVALLLPLLISTSTYALEKGFVYLSDVAPDIIQDMRYATSNNFIGNPIPGYKRGVCIVTKKTAQQLKKIQAKIKPKGYSLKVYDCYRPQKAVDYFATWSKKAKDERKKAEFYPREDKATLFDHDYIALQSGHTRGSTLDLSLVKLKAPTKAHRDHLLRCYSTTPDYQDDNSIDMGTRYDCLDVSANLDYKDLSKKQKANRALLQHLMTSNGFVPYAQEWWHFTLAKEPFPKTYFNFAVK